MPNPPRTARPGGTIVVDRAQAVVPVGPSGYPLPMDPDETLQVSVTGDLAVSPAIAPVVQALQVVSKQLADLTRLLDMRRAIDTQALPPDLGRWNQRPGKLRSKFLQIPGITTQGTPYTANDAVGLPFILEGMAGGPGECGAIVSVIGICTSVANGSFAIVMFRSPIGGSADNAALAPTDTEIATLAGVAGAGNTNQPAIALSVNRVYTTNWGVNAGPSTPIYPYTTGPRGELYCQCGIDNGITIAAGDTAYLLIHYVWGYPGMGSM